MGNSEGHYSTIWGTGALEVSMVGSWRPSCSPVMPDTIMLDMATQLYMQSGPSSICATCRSQSVSGSDVIKGKGHIVNT